MPVRTTGNDGDYTRKSWFRCACCPPNVMRTLSSLEHYVALGNDTQVLLHQYMLLHRYMLLHQYMLLHRYMQGSWTALVAGGEVTLDVPLDPSGPATSEHDDNLLGGVVVIRAVAKD